MNANILYPFTLIDIKYSLFVRKVCCSSFTSVWTRFIHQYMERMILLEYLKIARCRSKNNFLSSK